MRTLCILPDKHFLQKDEKEGGNQSHETFGGKQEWRGSEVVNRLT